MRVAKTEENVSHCICMYCPSYSQVCKLKNAPENTNRPTENLQDRTHYEKMFCAFEKSNCIHLDRGCICDKCEVHKQYGLHRHEYCLKTGGLQ